MISVKKLLSDARRLTREIESLDPAQAALRELEASLLKDISSLTSIDEYEREFFLEARRYLILSEPALRPAFVMAWCGIAHWLRIHLATNHYSKLYDEYGPTSPHYLGLVARAKPPSYKLPGKNSSIGKRLKELEKLAPNDDNLIDISEKAKAITSQASKQLKGLLVERNHAAHPSDFKKNSTQAVAYLQNLLGVINDVERTTKRHIKR